MGQGKGSGRRARVSLMIGIGIFCLLSIAKPTLAANYTVGGGGGGGGATGWYYNVNTNWPPHCMSFKTHDVLVFNYNKSYHNVVLVNKEDYESCTSPNGAQVHQTGEDRIKLRKGHNYFICGVPGHCQNGMKIHIYAA